MWNRWSPSRRELTLLAVALLAASCGGHAHPRVAGYYLAYSRGYQTAGEPPVVLARADGTGAHTIAHGVDPAVSPDGRWVAYDVYRGAVQKLFVVATRGGKPRLLARTDSWPVWSPSSDRIVTLKGNALVSVDLHGHVTVLDAHPNSGTGGWSVSPDGRWVVYNAGPELSCESDLFVVRAAGGGRHLVTRGAENSPVWGKHWVAFVREVPGCGGAAGIWRIRPDGTGLQHVLPPPRHVGRNGIWGFFPVAWAPDEHTLLAQVASPDAWDVAIRVDVATGRVRRLFGYPIDLSRDGRFALVNVGLGGRHQKIVALPFGRRGHARVLARGEVCCPSWNR